MAAAVPPTPDQIEIALVRARPRHRAAIRDSVVGNSKPAATPPTSRAPINT